MSITVKKQIRIIYLHVACPSQHNLNSNCVAYDRNLAAYAVIVILVNYGLGLKIENVVEGI
jgi:hypothetical protein